MQALTMQLGTRVAASLHEILAASEADPGGHEVSSVTPAKEECIVVYNADCCPDHYNAD